MNQKTIIRLVLGIIVAALGAWQMAGHSPSGSGTGSGKQGQRQHSGQNHSGAERSGTVGDFDYYVVSLSWSPAYCLTHPQDKSQCGGKGFGFVLHGVWPQKSTGGYPEDCPATSQPSASAIQKTLAFMPSEKLINHEWTKHGSCTGLSADAYLELADRAFGSIKIPTGFQAPESSRNLTADEILSEFSAANSSFPKDSLAVKCSGNQLEEVRVCVDPKLKPMSCGKGVRTQCSRDAVQVRSVR